MTREEAIARIKNHKILHKMNEPRAIYISEALDMAIEALEQKPRCKDCRWWKDSDGKYRRGCGAESQCPINTHAVYCGEGYCYMYEPQESEDRK